MLCRVSLCVLVPPSLKVRQRRWEVAEVNNKRIVQYHITGTAFAFNA